MSTPQELIAANGHADGERPEATPLTEGDAQLVRAFATMFIDVVGAFGRASGPHTHEEVPELPNDPEMVASTCEAGTGNAREVLSMLRAGLPVSAQETPVEALAHVRFLQSRGLGFNTVVKIYQYGFALFRMLARTELAGRVPDPRQAQRIGQGLDDYFFRYVGKVTGRLAAEYGLTEGAWLPTAEDPVLNNPASAAVAQRLREEELAKGTWLPPSPEQSRAREETERALEAFVTTVEHGFDDPTLSSRLTLADTTITITLADEPDLSVTLLLDRKPPEIVDGVQPQAESRIWIPSVDLNRIWLPDFYLPMAITKRRVPIQGDVRKFLRVVPVLRELGETYRQVTASMQTEEVR